MTKFVIICKQGGVILTEVHVVKLHPAEYKLINIIREVGFGAIKEITVYDSLPQYVVLQEERKIKL